MNYTFEVMQCDECVLVVVMRLNDRKIKQFKITSTSVDNAKKFMQSITEQQFKDMFKGV